MQMNEQPTHIATPEIVAWAVEIHDSTCIVFASTKAKAQMVATKSYWEAYGRMKGEWPRAKAFRAECYDKSALRFESQRAFCEDYVIDYPSRKTR